MRIAGFQPFTLSDYPGCTAAIVFTQGCQFRCPFCHNHTLLLDRELGHSWDQTQLLDQLNRRKGFLDGVVVSGGEPTLQPDLAAFLARIKAMDLLVKLDTNGGHPRVLRHLIAQGLVDFVAMDVKAPFHKYDQLAGVSVSIQALTKSIHIIAHSGIAHLFRTTWVPDLLTEQDIQQIRVSLPPGSPYKVQPFIAELALDPGLRLAG
jgi:pyruvate formate lyase activating enzyme